MKLLSPFWNEEQMDEVHWWLMGDHECWLTSSVQFLSWRFFTHFGALTIVAKQHMLFQSPPGHHAVTRSRERDSYDFCTGHRTGQKIDPLSEEYLNSEFSKDWRLTDTFPPHDCEARGTVYVLDWRPCISPTSWDTHFYKWGNIGAIVKGRMFSWILGHNFLCLDKKQHNKDIWVSVAENPNGTFPFPN